MLMVLESGIDIADMKSGFVGFYSTSSFSSFCSLLWPFTTARKMRDSHGAIVHRLRGRCT